MKKSYWNIKDKYSQTLIKKIELINTEQCDDLIFRSENAFNIIKEESGEYISKLLNDLSLELSKNKDLFVDLIVKECGKPIGYAISEVERAINVLKISSSESLRVAGEVVPMNLESTKNINSFTKKFPIGPILGISPFNFPLNLAIHKIGPAIASKNSIIIKPSPMAPLTILKFKELFDKVSNNKDLLLIACCDDQLAEHLVKHPKIKMISFTGSSTVGWKIKNIAGKKKVILELGGNATSIVDNTANLKQSAKLIAKGAFLFAGQICISTQKILVHTDIIDEFTKILISEVEQLKVGAPSDKNTIIGPIISSDHFYRIESWIKNSILSGAKLLIGGKAISSESHLFEATLLTNVSKSCNICKKEVFGPIAFIESFDSIEKAVELTNDSIYGLQAGVFSDSLENIKFCFNKLDVGAVIINNIPGFRIDSMPYGGIKDSGFGREGVKYSINEMTEEKLLVF